MKYNAAIYLLSSRVKLLEKCLNYLYKNWNINYNYPVHVHYFNNIYNKNYIKEINNKISKNIFFHQIDYKVPSQLSESELFYNRKNIEYVKKSFSKKRLGYLHGQRFWVNITSYGNTGCLVKEMSKYKYLMRIDDDSYFKKKINFDLFKVLDEYPIASGYMFQNYSQRALDTRVELWNFYKYYLKKYNYIPKNEILKKAFLENDESKMHSLFWTAGNCNLYNMEIFKNSPWQEYLDELNNFCGDYKYRWGDLETIGLFCYTHFDKNPYDFKLKDKNLYDNKFPSFLSSYAPGVDGSLNVHNFFILRWYYNIKFFILEKLFRKKIDDEFK